MSSNKDDKKNLNDLPMLICHFLPSSKISYINKAYCEYFKKEEHELVGKSFLTLIPEKDKDIVWNNILSLTIDNQTISHEHQVIENANKISWHKWINKALFNEQGEITSYLSIGEDITKRKTAEQELKKLTIAIEQSANIVVITDKEGSIEYVNPKFTEITGYTAQEAIGQNPRILKTETHPKEYYIQLWETITAGKIWKGEFHNKKKNGELFWEQTTITPVKDDADNIINYLAIKVDITERKEYEQRIQEQNDELKQINATKDKFFSIIAHDLKSPFNAILGLSQILVENHKEYDVEKRERLIKSVNISANSAFKLLENLLTWSLSHSGKIKYLPKKIDLKTLLSETMFNLQEQANSKEISILDTFSENDIIFADKDMIAVVFRNLISNAIKFTNRNGKIVISSIKQEQSNFLEISVSDTGIGIPKDKIDDLFCIDKNTSTKGTKNETGTGLGLILCKEFIEKHKGKIWVESEIGKGSSFNFTIPFKPIN